MRIRNLAKDPQAHEKMPHWGGCSDTKNDDGTWTYSPNKSGVTFSPNFYPVLTGNVFIIESSKGDLGFLSADNLKDFPIVGTVRDRYRVYRLVGGHCIIQYFSTAPWNPVGFAICDPDAYDLLQNAGLPLVFAATDRPY
ncbi:hypothetical protein [uncultured Bifidobacterium sp.]|uniref:hypothetical protein n=1 Tax=uncultured Bifidobacterium sp. TaxID=165187 RepID=UPI0025903C28|nr:hypothetical protein [uncultured Bifidobacterium sp.]